MFAALTGTAATLTDLDCEGIGLVRVAAWSPAHQAGLMLVTQGEI